MLNKYHLVVIGGGAAGFYTAIQYAEKNEGARVLILEKSPQVLGKVKISGGGRCNVTHACFDAKQLSTFYPRGEKELLSVFYKYNPTHTIEWFQKKGVTIKKETDGRMFPTTNNSQTIIDCFLKTSQNLNIEIRVSEAMISLEKVNNDWHVATSSKKNYVAHNVMIAGGSSEKLWGTIAGLNHTIIPPVPSLFTFNIKDSRLENLQGLSVPNASVQYGKITTDGPLLITHWGLSGPAVLKLSAWAARALFETEYRFTIAINFNNHFDVNSVLDNFLQQQKNNAKQKIANHHFPDIPNRLWQSIIINTNISQKNWADISKKEMLQLAQNITQASFIVNGKSTFKEEFVTAVGISLKEVDFKTMQSKLHENLFFSGEVLDIDAVTGGFNFQAAWSTAWLAAQHMK